MSKLKIDVEVDSLSELDLIDVNKYQFVVKFFKDGGILPLDHPSIPNTATVQVTTTTPAFSIIIDNVINMTDVIGVVKIYNNAESDCCVASETFVLEVGGGGGVDPTHPREILMNTTGYGFAPDELHGINGDWLERIMAYKFSWGWGITGISICMKWKDIEPTQGVYRLDGVQKNIDFCNANGLTLSYKFWALREDTDPMIHESEKQLGALGAKLMSGGEVSPSYGCNRTNSLIYSCVAAVTARLNTYSRKGHMLLAGGNTEELVYASPHNGEGALSQMTDLCDDSKARFNAWVSARGLTTPGVPPTINGIPWPRPDFNQILGLEFGRFLTYSMRKYVDNFVSAVKSVSNIPVLYYYAAHSGGQMPSTNNANFNFIAANCDGMYGTDGALVGGQTGKMMCNAINRGTKPDGISAVEMDADDLTNSSPTWIPYCNNQLRYAEMEAEMKRLFDAGCDIIHYAMAYCTIEIAGMDPYLKRVFDEKINVPFTKPPVTTSNTVVVNVVPAYRNGENYLWNVNPLTQYVKITDDNFFGGVTPFVE